jgi:hypothetical protein
MSDKFQFFVGTAKHTWSGASVMGNPPVPNRDSAGRFINTRKVSVTPLLRKTYKRWKNSAYMDEVPAPTDEQRQQLREFYRIPDGVSPDEHWYIMRFLSRMYNLRGHLNILQEETGIGKGTWHGWMNRFSVHVEHVKTAVTPISVDSDVAV